MFTGWQMSQLASIPENSDPFYSLTDSCPQTPPATFTSTDALPSIFTPGATKRRKYSVDPHIKILANQLIPPSTKPTRVQELGKSIKDVWQRRFTPKRVLNELYMPGVLYATRARFVRTEQDYWAVSQGALNSKGLQKD